MDFITKLPKSHHYDSILTITDHDCTKASLFIPCQEEITAEGVAHLFLTRVFRHYGLPSKIISDRDPRFTSGFMKELCRVLGIQQNVSTAYHPRTDGQSERTNQWLETYLRFFVNYQQDDWAQYLPIAEFAHNNWKNSTTGESPFYLLMGANPRADWTGSDSLVPQVTSRLDRIKQARQQAYRAMTRAQQMWVKRGVAPRYQEGDRVWVDGRNLKTDRPTVKLAARRHGPFSIRKVLSPINYQLTLPSHWKIHPVFHVDLLTPYRETDFHGRNYEYPPPDLVDNEEQYEVEHVLDSRTHGRTKKKQYLVKWKGYPESDNQWVNHEDMAADDAIQAYEQDKTRHPATKRRHRIALMSSPISSVSSIELIPNHDADAVAEARASFPTPEPGHISPDSTLSLDLALDPATRVEPVTLEEGVRAVEAGADSTASGGAENPPEYVASLCRCGSGMPERGPRTGLGQCDQPPEASCPFRNALQTCRTHGARCPICVRLVENCECNARSTYEPTVLEAIEGVMEAARRARGSTRTRAQERARAYRLADSDSTVNAEENEEITTRRARGRRGGRGRGGARASAPVAVEVRRETGTTGARLPRPAACQQEAPALDRAYDCPQGFWLNVPPNFIPFKLRHQGETVQARYVTVHFRADPVVWGTMGWGFRVFEQEAHVAPQALAAEVDPYTHNSVRLFHSRYPGRSWVDNALLDEGDEGLRAEVLRYRKKTDELHEKEEELSAIQDRIGILLLDLRATLMRLARAEAVPRIEEHRTTAVETRTLTAWAVERGRST